MSESDPTARTLRLLSLLQAGRVRSGPELAERLGASPRTVRRDVERLRGLGYVVETRSGPGGEYRLMPGPSVPPLLFEDDEAIVVVAGLRMMADRLGGSDAALRARIKLERVLPPRLRARAAAAGAMTETLPERFPDIDPEVIGSLADAAAVSGRVRFGYQDRHGRESSRLADPYRHVVAKGVWYLLAFDVDRDDWRVFRLDRVTGVTRVPGTYRRRDLPGDSVADYLRGNLAAEEVAVEVVFAATVARMTGLLPQDGELVAVPDGRCRYLTRVTDLDWFAARMAVLGVPFTVGRPSELADVCRRMAAVLGNEGSDEGGDGSEGGEIE